jgi:hypothetical protein
MTASMRGLGVSNAVVSSGLSMIAAAVKRAPSGRFLSMAKMIGIEEKTSPAMKPTRSKFQYSLRSR